GAFLLVTSVQMQMVCLFFQAEDGIRVRNVTGVQTCALPISHSSTESIVPFASIRVLNFAMSALLASSSRLELVTSMVSYLAIVQIGRASCRERVEVSVVGV